MNSYHQYLATILCSSFVLWIILSWKRKRNAKTGGAPEPAGAWPLIGHLHMLRPPQPPHKTLGSLADKYGGTFTIQLGLHRALVVNTWEAAKECFTTNDKIFATRPSSVGSKIMGYNYAMFGLAPYGQYWRESYIKYVQLVIRMRKDGCWKHFELIPFGSGRRSCPGTSLALQTVHLSLARLLQGFEFLTPHDAPVDMTESPGLTNLKTTPLQVLLNPRLPSHLY